ncbi:hypothetical protein CE91St58_33420 [Lachnospiraceae bacterium]|nr:hypothetical protein CE91St58_33420 [Lachnospiraceae bacterium]
MSVNNIYTHTTIVTRKILFNEFPIINLFIIYLNNTTLHITGINVVITLTKIIPTIAEA